MSDLRHGLPHRLALVAADRVDAGLRRYMLDIYNQVALGLLVAGGLAYVVSAVPTVRDLLFRLPPPGAVTPMVGLTFAGAFVAFGPFLALAAGAFALDRPTLLKARLVYWSVVSTIGASLGLVVLTFTGASIAATLAISALAFGGLSLAGYVTPRDLTALGGFLTTGLVGVVAALILNLALRSPAVVWIASMVGVFVFAGLIAYDTQRLKLAYDQVQGDRTATRLAATYGALSLFINFVNLFQLLLMSMTGDRR